MHPRNNNRLSHLPTHSAADFLATEEVRALTHALFAGKRESNGVGEGMLYTNILSPTPPCFIRGTPGV